MAGQTAARLFKLLPPLMPLTKKYELTESLWRHVGPASKRRLRVGLDADLEVTVGKVREHIDGVVSGYQIPEALTRRFEWISSGVHEFSQALTGSADGDGGPGKGSNDADITYRVAGLLPVIMWDPEEQRRKVVKMRWGFPSPKDWRRPQPIHARAETIDELRAFRGAFAAGQRGIVLFRTFNEGEMRESLR